MPQHQSLSALKQEIHQSLKQHLFFYFEKAEALMSSQEARTLIKEEMNEISKDFQLKTTTSSTVIQELREAEYAIGLKVAQEPDVELEHLERCLMVSREYFEKLKRGK